MNSQILLVFSAICGLVVTLPAPENDPDADKVPDRVMINLEEVSVELYADGSEKLQGIEELMEVARMKLEGSKNPNVKTKGRKPEEEEGNDRSRRYIFWPDDRTCPVINCAVGQLANGCTAVFIGPYHALTAAHCVYDITTGSWRSGSNFNICRGRTCNNYGDCMTWTSVHVPIGYTVYGLQQYDYALIVYDSSDPSPCYMGFGYVDPWPNAGFSVTCYPIDRHSPWGGCFYDSMCISSCSSSTTAHDGLTIVHTCDTMAGCNGAPMHREDLAAFPPGTGDEIVYGVNVYQSLSVGNFGPRIDRDRFYQILSWMYQSGYYPTVN